MTTSSDQTHSRLEEIGKVSNRFQETAVSGSARELTSTPAQSLETQVMNSLKQSGPPEMAEVTFGFLPLTDAAPFFVAKEQGFFNEHGIKATMLKESSWSGVRNTLEDGRVHVAQMLYGMPVASASGMMGDGLKPLIVPWVMSRNGQAITLNKQYRGQVGKDAEKLRDRVIEQRDKGRPLIFGHTLRIGTHAMWLRYWLAAGGIDPTNDVALITVPPTQMVANMKSARMDGFCVGEPWNVRAIAEDVGFTAITSQEIWPDHPEKVCVFTEEFALRNPRTTVAILKALYQAGQWLDNPGNHDAAAELLARPEYLNCDPAWVRSRLGHEIDYGDGRKATLKQTLSFSGLGANRPRPSQAIWFLTQLRRWGLHFGEPDYQGLASRVIRPEFFEQAISELGVVDPSPADGPVTLFDGKVFDPSSPVEYVNSFAIKSLQG